VWERVQLRLEELLAEWEPRTTAKQRLTGVRLHRALREEGYQAGLTAIHEYLRERRRQRTEVYVPLIHRAGDEAQVDFFEVTVELDGTWVKAWKFLLRLMYSGREFVWLYRRCDKLAFSTAMCGPSPIWVGFRAAACMTICRRQCARSWAGSVS
jgi:transposase